MQFYRVTDTVIVPAGCILQLNEKQISNRKQNLIIRAKGKCESASVQQFKRGEVLGIENPNKIMLKCLELIEEKKIDAKV